MKARILDRPDVFKIVDQLQEQGYTVIAPFTGLGRDTYFDTVTAGSVTLIPILMIDINFGGAGLVSPGGPSTAVPKAAAPQAPLAGADGFLMSGEARPLGFVVVTKCCKGLYASQIGAQRKFHSLRSL